MEGETTPEAIAAVWNCAANPPHNKWKFWQLFAATCLAETTNSTMLEDSTVPLLTSCDAGGLSVIERLLVEYDCS
jgi:hypothetical protein